MKTFTFCSFKGGTSKTSTALHVGASLAKFHGKKVLLIDFDSQANLSIGLGMGPDNLKTMVPVLQGKEEIESVIEEIFPSQLYLIPANAYLDGIERTPELGNDPYAHERLKRAVKRVENEEGFVAAPLTDQAAHRTERGKGDVADVLAVWLKDPHCRGDIL